MPNEPNSAGRPLLLRSLLTEPVFRGAIRSVDEFKIDENLPDDFKELLHRLDEKERADG